MLSSNSFSSIERRAIIDKQKQNTFDVLIIGGGIAGAGIALDAASRGLSVALIEKNDFASGTSSRSTKLIHGGLRYLENFEFNLVKKIGHEREIVHRNAPHLVTPQKMILPVIKGGKLNKPLTSLALSMYDFLAGVKSTEKHRMLSYKATLEKEPLLNKELLKCSAMYFEYKTDDARLTIEILKKAAEYGACAVNYTEMQKFLYENGKIDGVEAFDLINSFAFQIKAKCIVNATGVWVDEIRKLDKSIQKKRLHITKGIHIVVSREKFSINHAVYFDTTDKRMVFAIPKKNKVYIGTTDTDYSGNMSNPNIKISDVNYLISNVNLIFPFVNLKFTDVESAWAGLRPLIHVEGKSPSELSRKDEIFNSKNGLISIAGGKLTGYRWMAEKIVNLICKKISENENKSFSVCKTKNLKVSGGEFDFAPTLSSLIEYNDKKFDEAKQTGISVDYFKTLFYRYGKNIDIITEKAYDFYNETRNTEKSWLLSEIWYAVNYEMAANLCDFFIRRTSMLFFSIQEIEPKIDFVADNMANLLNWHPETKQKNIKALKTEIEHATNFKSD